MFKKKFCLLLAVMILVNLILGCSAFEKQKSYVIMSWNVQNLMDGNIDGTEYSEYQDGDNWKNQDYIQRLGVIGNTILRLDPQPDLILFQEVENDKVMKDLVEKYLIKKGFRWYGVTAEPEMAIQMAFASKLEINSTDVRILGVPNQRPVIQINLNTEGGNMIIYAVHAKSRVEGVENTEQARIMTSKVLSDAVDNAKSIFPGAGILICGDFNEDLADSDLEYTALVSSSSPSASASANMGALVISGNRDEVRNSISCWYSFWYDDLVNKQKEGSYCYQGVWNKFDNILCSAEFLDGSGLELDTGGVYSHWSLCDSTGAPNRFKLNTKSGVSDHLPIWVRLIWSL